MKQGRSYLKAIMMVFAVMISSYILYYFVSSSGETATTEAAIISVAEAEATSGLIVRQEEVITAGSGTVSPLCSQGEKVANGQTVAITLQSPGIQQKLFRINELKQQKEQLELALSYQIQLTDRDAITEKTAQTIVDFSTKVSVQSLNAADSSAEMVKSLVLRQTLGAADATALTRQLNETIQELDRLQEETREDTAAISAHASGYYSPMTDGFETTLTPDAAKSMTTAQLDGLLRQSGSAVPNSAGRLILSDTWYYVASVSTDRLEDLAVGNKLTVSFQGDFLRELRMEIAAINKEEGGRSLLVLKSNKFIAEVSALRQQDTEIIFRSYSGLRVPKNAICYSEEENSAGVYVLEGAKARWKNVELLYDGGDYYVVTLDRSSTKNLWPEDSILLDTEKMYDGMVIA